MISAASSPSSRRHFIKATGLALGASSLPSLSQSPAIKKTVLLHSAWAVKNIGDIGHTPGTLRVLEQHLPDVHIILWAAHVNEPVEAMLRTRFPKVEIVQGKLTENDGPVQKAIARADFFMRNSGMGQDTTFMVHCRKVGKPYGLYGQSYFTDMVSGEGAETRIDHLNNASFIYTRESKTLAILKAANVKTPVLEFGPDGCFGIDVRDETRGLARMKKHGLEDRKFITIQLRTHTPTSPGVDDNRPQKLNPLNPTPQMIADDERRAKVYQDLITMWVKKTGLKVLIAPEVYKEMEHNKRFIYDKLPPEIQQHVVNLDEFWNADEAASVFARAHTVVCHEPHSPIIALANGTPIIHTYSEFHSPKCWMFQDIGLSEWLPEFDSTPAEKMFEILMSIHNDYEGALAKVEKAMAFVHQKQAEGMQTLKKLIS
ncbi:polysaccharide pyruvyl transferase family protein [Phragmitibacter flavus]|uniref:Polysaccharide pyruvyl transferase family protein n=1 Tax=Phragmitibacter flavus TaxID=2576071 RepID=A0A5R8KGX1_9BACT|nr:polysaccharide pyruvyl transferase family protein [Phragmitibacter flavus]TLD70849.1 polysaccharide pyruvyl transferase family protein [Phragmitibacter flavus]